METLKLENISPYLPYGLKAKGTDDTIYHVLGAYDEMGVGKGKNLMPLYNEQYGRVLIDYTERFGYDFKPILRPMDLTKPIIVEGKEIIPIVELAKIAFPETEWVIEKGKCISIIDGFYENTKHQFIYHSEINCFANNYAGSTTGRLTVRRQLELFKKLYEWKFDVEGLIEKGLAIDVSALNTNPYNT